MVSGHAITATLSQFRKQGGQALVLLFRESILGVLLKRASIQRSIGTVKEDEIARPSILNSILKVTAPNLDPFEKI